MFRESDSSLLDWDEEVIDLDNSQNLLELELKENVDEVLFWKNVDESDFYKSPINVVTSIPSSLPNPSKSEVEKEAVTSVPSSLPTMKPKKTSSIPKPKISTPPLPKVKISTPPTPISPSLPNHNNAKVSTTSPFKRPSPKKSSPSKSKDTNSPSAILQRANNKKRFKYNSPQGSLPENIPRSTRPPQRMKSRPPPIPIQISSPIVREKSKDKMSDLSQRLQRVTTRPRITPIQVSSPISEVRQDIKIPPKLYYRFLVTSVKLIPNQEKVYRIIYILHAYRI